MKRRKKNLTRKGRVLRLGAGLAVVVLLTSWLDLYDFLPIQTIRGTADAQDIEKPKVIETFCDGSMPGTRISLCHLVQGTDALMFCTTGYNPFVGWYERSWSVVETWEETGLYGGVCSQRKGDEQTVWLFGKIEDEAVKHLALVGNVQYGLGAETTYRAEIREEDVFEKDGQRYFLSKLPDFPRTDTIYVYDARLIGWDEEGETVKSVKAPVRIWGSA